MKYRILSLVAFLVVMVLMSSCGYGRWQRYNYRGHYVNKKNYHSYHKHRNRDW